MIIYVFYIMLYYMLLYILLCYIIFELILSKHCIILKIFVEELFQ